MMPLQDLVGDKASTVLVGNNLTYGYVLPESVRPCWDCMLTICDAHREWLRCSMLAGRGKHAAPECPAMTCRTFPQRDGPSIHCAAQEQSPWSEHSMPHIHFAQHYQLSWLSESKTHRVRCSECHTVAHSWTAPCSKFQSTTSRQHCQAVTAFNSGRPQTGLQNCHHASCDTPSQYSSTPGLFGSVMMHENAFLGGVTGLNQTKFDSRSHWYAASGCKNK